MYIVISKPKRMSSKDGFDHFIATSWKCVANPVGPIVRRPFGASLLSELPHACVGTVLRADAHENHEFRDRRRRTPTKARGAQDRAHEPAGPPQGRIPERATRR